MGGEKSMKYVGSWNGWGSPPHGRGKVFPCGVGQFKQRITPAWAGKRDNERIQSTANWDHPRMGGEKFPTNGDSVAKQGSPPHGRGKDNF